MYMSDIANYFGPCSDMTWKYMTCDSLTGSQLRLMSITKHNWNLLHYTSKCSI